MKDPIATYFLVKHVLGAHTRNIMPGVRESACACGEWNADEMDWHEHLAQRIAWAINTAMNALPAPLPNPNYSPLYGEKRCDTCGFWRGQHFGTGEKDDEMYCPITFEPEPDPVVEPILDLTLKVSWRNHDDSVGATVAERWHAKPSSRMTSRRRVRFLPADTCNNRANIDVWGQVYEIVSDTSDNHGWTMYVEPIGES